MTDSEWAAWGFPCPACGTYNMTVRYLWDTPRKGRVKIEFACSACGVGESQNQPAELVDFPPVGAIEPARRGYYERLTCEVCGRILKGRQRRFCSDRCRKRHSRKADIRGH